MNEYNVHSCCWITVNRACNLNCLWCYGRRSQVAVNSDMSKGLLFNLIDLCHQGGVKKIVFLGGEPTIYPYLFEGISRCRELSIRSEITTNGVLMSDNSYLKSLIDAGLNSIMLSVKGGDNNDFLNTTGKDQFSSVLKAINNIYDCGIKFGLSAVLTTSFIENMDYLLGALANKRIKPLVFSFLKEFGDDDESRAFYEDNEPEKLLGMLYRKLRDSSGLLNDVEWFVELCGPLSVADKEVKMFFREKIHNSCRNTSLAPLAFDPSGGLLYCNTIPDVTYGKYGVDFNDYEQLRQYIICQDL